MRRLRPSAVVAVVAAALALAGCYGSTEPATQIDFDQATLNAHGTANAGDAHVYFRVLADGPSTVRCSRPSARDVPGRIVG